MPDLHPSPTQAWKLAAEDARFFRVCIRRWHKYGVGHEIELFFAHNALARSVFHLLHAWGSHA